MEKAADDSTARMVFVDALRGIAAVGVLIQHLTFNSFYSPILAASFPAFLTGLFGFGRYGVHVFFVISGFVITHSLRRNPATPRSLGNFILRRQVRLDPPYWTVLFLVMAWGLFYTPQFGSPPTRDLRTIDLFANFTYLQRILETHVILGVAWTLCLEIQFYLLCILLILAGLPFSRGRRSRTVEATLLLITGAASILVTFNAPEPPAGVFTWFYNGWFYFVGGALAYLSVRDRDIDGTFRAFLIVYAACYSLGVRRWPPDAVIGFLAILLIWGVGKSGKLTTWLGQGVFQYFGRVSYSLYLIHWPITVTLMNFGYSRTSHLGDWTALVWFAATSGVSFLAAHLLYIAVERPSMRLASSLKRPEPEASLVPVVPAVAAP